MGDAEPSDGFSAALAVQTILSRSAKSRHGLDATKRGVFRQFGKISLNDLFHFMFWLVA
jgi:hypothetical protein